VLSRGGTLRAVARPGEDVFKTRQLSEGTCAGVVAEFLATIEPRPAIANTSELSSDETPSPLEGRPAHTRSA
jgi:hypothetical protein